MNPHKNMNLWKLWITKEEQKSIEEIIRDKDNLEYSDYSRTLGDILQEAIKRGDLIK